MYVSMYLCIFIYLLKKAKMYIDIVEAVEPSEEYKEPPTELCDYL